MTLRRPVSLLLFLVVTAPSAAWGQSESDKGTARELGQEGQRALDGGDWKLAEDRFHRADSLFHAPTLTIGLARAQAHQGKVVEAWESYHRIILDNVTSPPVFAKALEDARAELPAVEARRARLTVTVTGSDAPHVAVNDAPVRVEALGVARFVNPGHLVVTATADGMKPETRALDLADGKDATLSIALQKAELAQAGAAPVAATPAGSAPPAAPGAPSHGSILKPLGYGALAVGGAGLVLGAVTGGLALGKHGDLNTACPGGSCTTAASQSTLSSYHTLGALSTVGFIVMVAGGGGGLTMLLMAPKSDSQPPPATASIRPYFGLGTVGAVGTF